MEKNICLGERKYTWRRKQQIVFGEGVEDIKIGFGGEKEKALQVASGSLFQTNGGGQKSFETNRF